MHMHGVTGTHKWCYLRLIASHLWAPQGLVLGPPFNATSLDPPPYTLSISLRGSFIEDVANMHPNLYLQHMIHP